MELCADIDIEYGIIATAIINLQTSIVLMYLRQMLRNGDAKWLDSKCATASTTRITQNSGTNKERDVMKYDCDRVIDMHNSMLCLHRVEMLLCGETYGS